MRHGGDGVGALADGAHDSSFGDLVAARHADRAQLQQCDGVAVGRLDRHRTTAAGNLADERDAAGSRRMDGATELTADVDSTMLPACVDVVAERERAQYRPVTGPGPRMCDRRDGERRQDDRDNECSPHRKPPSVVVERNFPSTLAVAVSGFSTILNTKRYGKCAPAGRRRRRPGDAADPRRPTPARS